MKQRKMKALDHNEHSENGEQRTNGKK